jgi:hypothetical protein
MDHANAMTFGIHYGSRMRIYLSLETANAQETSLALESLQPQKMKLASLTESCGIRIENVLAEKTRIQAAISVPEKDACEIVRP